MTEALTGQKPAVFHRIPCEQWFLPAGRHATKGEKPLRKIVCFFDRAAVSAIDGREFALFLLPVFIAIILTQSLCQMWANLNKRNNISSLLVYVLHKKREIGHFPRRWILKSVIFPAKQDEVMSFDVLK